MYFGGLVPGHLVLQGVPGNTSMLPPAGHVLLQGVEGNTVLGKHAL